MVGGIAMEDIRIQSAELAEAVRLEEEAIRKEEERALEVIHLQEHRRQLQERQEIEDQMRVQEFMDSGSDLEMQSDDEDPEWTPPIQPSNPSKMVQNRTPIPNIAHFANR